MFCTFRAYCIYLYSRVYLHFFFIYLSCRCEWVGGAPTVELSSGRLVSCVGVLVVPAAVLFYPAPSLSAKL